ncbi:MAG: hypothetical protein IPK66_03025 [Rhodospirillales bacterium]|nr:hypothetical protein [Rhodospirillales bacterium]
MSLQGWSSARIAEAFSVEPNSVRHWRWTFGREGVAGLRARKAPGPEPVKARAALAVVSAVLTDEVADRRNWTLPRLQNEIERRTGERISKSRLSVVMRKKGLSLAATPAHAEGAAGRPGRRSLRPAASSAEAAGPGRRPRAAVRRRVRGAHPSLSRACVGRARRRPARRSARPGAQGGDDRRARLRGRHAGRRDQPEQAKQRFHRSADAARRAPWPAPRPTDEAGRARHRQRSPFIPARRRVPPSPRGHGCASNGCRGTPRVERHRTCLA